MRDASFLAFGVVFAACGLPKGAHTENDAKPLAIHNVEWNPTHAKVGKAIGVAELDGDVVVVGENDATVFESGAPLNVDSHGGGLRSLGVIPAPDGTGTWLAGIAPDGKVVRLRERKAFEAVSGRYGLDGAKVSGVAGTGDRVVAFELGGEVAVADGKEVRRFPSPTLTGLFAGGGEIAGLTSTGVWLFDPASKAPRSFSLPGARFIAVDEKGRLYAASDEAVYADRGDGTLALRFQSRKDAIHGLVASGNHVWFTDGTELGVVGGGEGDVSLTHGANVPASSRLAGSPSGDVWTIDASGDLARWAMGAAKTVGAEAAWAATAEPVFARVCSSCHGKGGSSGIDLSSEASWREHANSVRTRVFVDRDMPPKGQLLSDDDRDAIRRFIDSVPARDPLARHD